MSASVSPRTMPQYLQIAKDIAERIANGDLPEGSLLHGRSVLASRYQVSGETIRRSLHLLEDMKVVDIRPQGGAKVLSSDNARLYLDTVMETADEQDLRAQLKSLVEQSVSLHSQIMDTVSALLRSNETMNASHCALPNYEVTVLPGSPVIGRDLRDLQFWQNTGATVVAIRRNQKLITSPGPYAELHAGDIIIIVGTTSEAEKTKRFVNGEMT